MSMKEAKLPYDVKRQLLDKSHDVTDDKYGCIPSKRPLIEYVSKGVINLDKPAGPTSHEVVAWVKKIFGIEKAGHGGTLEPLLRLVAYLVAKQSQGHWSSASYVRACNQTGTGDTARW